MFPDANVSSAQFGTTGNLGSSGAPSSAGMGGGAPSGATPMLGGGSPAAPMSSSNGSSMGTGSSC